MDTKFNFLSHLPSYNGVPAPYTCYVDADGNPSFNHTDDQKWGDCVSNGKCCVCGKKLSPPVYFTGGPLSTHNRIFGDPAMHLPCALYAIKLQPYAMSLVPPDLKIPPLMRAAVPRSLEKVRKSEILYITAAKNYRVITREGDLMIQALDVIGTWHPRPADMPELAGLQPEKLTVTDDEPDPQPLTLTA